MSAAVLTIGTELTRGELVDSNSAWLASVLTQLGFEVTALASVDDDSARIQRVLRALGAEHRVVVCTGGLGPTSDDITAQSVARLLGVPLERDPASLALIREKLAKAGRVAAPSNDKQADFPRGSRVLDNREGTAPGFAVGIGAARAFFLPGVPHEMRAMFRRHVEPGLAAEGRTPAAQIHIQTYGLPESAVNDRLDGIEAEHGVTLGYRAHFPEVEVKVLARDAEPAQGRQRARVAADAVEARLGAAVFAEGHVSFVEAFGQLLVERGLTLGLAESCTGGLIAELVTRVSGASRYFLGGIVSYHNDAKRDLLGVAPELLAVHGAVSSPVARAMAEGTRRVLGCDVAISVTGIAGPDGGSDEKPVGLVHYAVAVPDATSDRDAVFPGDRQRIRRRAAYAAIGLAREVVLGA